MNGVLLMVVAAAVLACGALLRIWDGSPSGAGGRIQGLSRVPHEPEST